MYSKINGGKNILVGVHFSLLKAMEIGKGKEALIRILFKKIKENRRKGRWNVTNLHEEEIEGKIENNEENIGLNDKKDSKDQFMSFVGSMVDIALYIISLILLHT